MTAAEPAQLLPPHVLREYVLLADGERGAILGPHGDIAWMCVPRWDSDAVFSSLLGGRGVYAVTPRSRFVWGGYYEPGSLIWVNRWTTETGIVECRDALVYPGDPDRAVLLRQIIAREGDAEVDVVLDPRANFGSTSMTRTRCQDGVWSARTGDIQLRWQGAAEARRVTGRATGLRVSIALRHGESRDLVLEMSDRPLPDTPVDAQSAWYATNETWPAAVPEITKALAPTAGPAQLRRPARTDQFERRHGRSGDHEPARAGPDRPQLRLPLRLDQGPVLRRRGRGGRRAGRSARKHRCASSATVCARTARSSRRRTRPPATGFPTSGTSACRDIPAGWMSPATGSTTSSSWTRSARRCCCSRPQPNATCSTPRVGGPRRSRRARSGSDGANPMPASGRSTTNRGRTAV